MTDPRVTPGSGLLADPRLRTMERMASGTWYLPGEEMARAQERARRILKRVNERNEPASDATRADLAELLADGSHVPEWWSPVYAEYGLHTSFGEGCYVNVGMTILDSAPVTIGARTMFGPNCEIVTVGHPVHDLEMRRAGWEIASPVTIGDDCWFGASVHVMPGVTVGDRVVAAAGAVITKDVPSDSLVAGVPARVVKSLDDSSQPLERDQLDV